jgi:hypothetical protein
MTSSAYLPALIGAGSALAGVLVTGSFALLKGRQDRSEKQRDRDEQRRVMHRTTRRDVYLGLLTAYGDVEAQLERALLLTSSSLRGTDVPAEFRDFDAAIRTIRAAVAVVTLEGPTSVSVAASAIPDACVAAFIGLGTAALDSNEDVMITRLLPPSTPGRPNVLVALRDSRDAFIVAAREALGGNAPGFG